MGELGDGEAKEGFFHVSQEDLGYRRTRESDGDLAQQREHSSTDSCECHLSPVVHNHFEAATYRSTEIRVFYGNVDLSIFVDPLDALLHASNETLDAVKHHFCQFVVLPTHHSEDLFLVDFQHDLYPLDNCD